MAMGILSDKLIDRGWNSAQSRIRILQCISMFSPAVFFLPMVSHHGVAIALLSIVLAMSATWLGLSGLLMADLVPHRQVGTAVALISAFGAGIGALCNLLIGQLVQRFGYAPIFAVGSLLHPVAALSLWWFYQRKPVRAAGPT
jgi:ACS family hexuronate transporter-like MFS transporter